MHDQVFYLSFLIFGSRYFIALIHMHHNLSFSATFPDVFLLTLQQLWFFNILSALYIPTLSTPLPSPHLLPPGWKAILVVDWRMMLLLRESLHQHRGMRGERKEREKSSGGVVAPWGAVAVMGELSNAPLSKLPSKHHVTTRD